jgi:alditol oxidase
LAFFGSLKGFRYSFADAPTERPSTMKKRTFLKLAGAMGAKSILSPLVTLGAKSKVPERLKNWAGNIEYSTESLYPAKSVAEAKEYIKKTGKLKVLGTRHCFNTIADSKDGFLSLTEMHNEPVLNEATRHVIVDANITYGRLAPWLEEKGFALHNLASLPHISVAGAISTGTHGSGEKIGNLSTAVRGFDMVTADGHHVEGSREENGETFRAAVVSLGALGAITRIALDVQPTFQARQWVYENMPLEAALAHFDEIQASGYSVSLFTGWRNKNVNEVWIKERVGGAKQFEPKPEWFGAKLAKKNLHPIAELGAENCTEQMGVPGPWFERLPHFKMGFMPSAGKELQSEFFVPRAQAVEAIAAVEKLHEKISPHLLITEIRTIAADNLWLSPCYQQDSVAIHFTWQQDWPAVKAVLPEIEQALAPFGVRPHWGKLFTIEPTVLRSRYEKMPEFVELAKKYDPQGKFRNEFLNRNIFAG